MTVVPLVIFAAAILAQARHPDRRLPIVLVAAGLALLALALGGGRAQAVLAALPWDVLIILAALGVVSRVLALSHVFTRLAVVTTRGIGASPALLVPVASASMFVISGLVNNITALVLVLPVVITILQLSGTTERHLRWTIGSLLVACNLGGAATPIGDFPAVLLLGAGAMEFVAYLRLALPTATAGLVLFLGIVVAVVQPARGVPVDVLRRRITVAVVEGLHDRIRLQRRLLVPALLALGSMLAAWTLVPPRVGVPVHLIAWLGAGLLVFFLGSRGRAVVMEGVDVEATLFIFGLLVMVGAVRETGLFTTLAGALQALPLPPAGHLALFVGVAAVSTGFFSAGPSMAALLEVAAPLVNQLGADAVYIGLAFGVCAGSSLFLTAATSGPLAQSMVERAGLTDVAGRRLQFSFLSFVPVGLVGFAIILTVGIGAALIISGRVGS
ncbi:MAG: permease [Acidobacteria bacterium]|nr:permease [Acidobacteriota bacterium]